MIWDDEGGDEDGRGNDELGAKGEFTVTGPASDAELPAQPATVTATDDAPSADAEGETYRLEVREPQGRHQPGALREHRRAAEGPPPVDFESGVGTSVIDGGIAQNITLDLEAGRYAVICFISDRKGGKPHVAKGMIDELVVEQGEARSQARRGQPGNSSSSSASSITGTPSRSAFSSFEPGVAPATT